MRRSRSIPSNNQPRRLIFSRDGDRLVIVDDKIRWCNAVSGEVIATVDQKFDRMESLALSADGLTLAIVGHGAAGFSVSIFRLDAAAKTVTPLAKDFDIGQNAECLRADSGWRADRCQRARLNGSLLVFDTATGRTIARHGSAHASPIAAMAFPATGPRLATADFEGTIKIWEDAQKLHSNSTALLTLKGHQGAINRVGFSSDGKRLVTTSADKTARVWDLENAGAAIRPLERAELFLRGTLFARWPTDRRRQRQQRASVGRRHGANCAGAVGRRQGSSLQRGVLAQPTTACWLSGTAERADVSHVALWDIDAGTELHAVAGSDRSARLLGWAMTAARSVLWRFRLMGNIWSLDSAQRACYSGGVLPLH